MSRKRNPQEAPALALVQIVREFPELPSPEWHVHTSGTLHGHLHEGGVEALGAWAAVLGGEIVPVGRGWEWRGQAMRTHRLSTVWRDVRVEVAVSVPVGAAAAGSAVAA